MTKQSWKLGNGDEISERLFALKHLGGGTRYQAYLAWDEHLYAVVVAKLLRPDLVESESDLKALRKEHDMLARVAHPVLPRTFGGSFDGEKPHIVLEHLEGPRLSTLVRRYGGLPAEQLLPLALQLCSALHYLHEEGIVHLDVKPSNIIMSGPPRLIDLSVARTIEKALKLNSTVGTDDYMAPEQCLPENGVTVAADVWGLGAALYKAATGELPFSEGADDKDPDNPEKRWPCLVEDPRPFPDRFPRAIAEPILSCLQRDPAARPTPAELHDTLEPLLKELPKPVLGRLKPKLH